MKSLQTKKPRKSVNMAELAEIGINQLPTMRHEETKPVEMGKVSTKRRRGKPTFFTPEVITKLETAFAIGASVKAACFYAGVSSKIFYDFLLREPKYRDRFEELKEKPILKALQTIVQALDDPEMAKWYVERKLDEFKPETKIKHSGGVLIGHLLKTLEDIDKNDGIRPKKIEG